MSEGVVETPAAPAVDPAPAAAPDVVVTTPSGDPPALPIATQEPRVATSFENFRAGLSDDLRANPVWDQYTERGLEGIAKDFVEQGRLIGSETRISRPAEDAEQSDWDRFYNTLGRPESADGYDIGDFTPPEGLPWDEEGQTRLMGRMHEIGLTNDQMQKALRVVAEDQNSDYQKMLLEAQTKAETTREGLRQEWGAAYDGNVERAEKAWNFMFGGDAVDMGNVELPGYGRFGAIPAVVKAFAKLGESMSDDKMVGGESTGGGIMTRDAARAEYERMQTDPDTAKILASKSDPQHKAMMRRWTQIASMAYPDT